ncbi:DUF4328 domain-containing protein [Gordonia sp. NPDC003424]
MARRPPEAIPPRRAARPSGPRLIPRYVYVPHWGLRDVPLSEVAESSPSEHLAAALLRALQVLAVTLGISAGAHLLRYLLLVVNRSTPVPAWTDMLTTLLVLFGGIVSLFAFAYATVVFVRWIIELRSDAYRRHDRRDPRRRWVVALLAGVPLVNVLGAGLLLHEVTAMRDDLDAAMTRDRLTRVWVAWAIVNGLAILALATRVVAWRSGSIQTGANGLLAVAVCSAVSAVFAWWLARRIDSIFAGVRQEPVPERRWVAVV